MIRPQVPHKPIRWTDCNPLFHTRMRRPLMSLQSRMREKLMISLKPVRLDVVNESHLHAGHGSSPETGESHFRVLVVSEDFTGKSRLARHRIVNDVLSDELNDGVHALAIKALAPGEPA